MKNKALYILALLVILGTFTAHALLQRRSAPATYEPLAASPVVSDPTPTPTPIPTPVPSPTQVATTSSVSLTITPSVIRQGDPAMVVVNGLTASSSVKSLTFNGKSVPVFTYNSRPTALIAIDLRMNTGSYPLVLTLSDGRKISKSITVTKRPIASEELGIPDKLGGNTQAGQDNVTNLLIKESALVATVPSTSAMLWSGLFQYPITEPITITDPYGDTRVTVGTTIAHKGTDFRAPIGTPVYAMNSGRVAFVRALTSYGNTVIIDHGLGLQTIYMHLSEFSVKEGDMVTKGELIGKSGDTGYVVGPHLHLSIKIGGVSIDPMKFMALLGVNQI